MHVLHVQCGYVNVVMSKGDQMQRDRDVNLGMHEAYHHNDMQMTMRSTSVTSYCLIYILSNIV